MTKGQKMIHKNDKRTENDPQNTKDPATETPLKTEDELRWKKILIRGAVMAVIIWNMDIPVHMQPALATAKVSSFLSSVRCT